MERDGESRIDPDLVARVSAIPGSGQRWLKTALVQAAWAAFRARKTHLSRKFRRIAGNRGKKRTAIAVAHTILVIIYHLLKEGTTYREIADGSEAA